MFGFFISLYIVFGTSTAGEADPLVATAGRVFRVHAAQTRRDKILPLANTEDRKRRDRWQRHE